MDSWLSSPLLKLLHHTASLLCIILFDFFQIPAAAASELGLPGYIGRLVAKHAEHYSSMLRYNHYKC